MSNVKGRSYLINFIDECVMNKIFRGLVLFNKAVLKNQKNINLFWDDSELETYITKLLPLWVFSSDLRASFNIYSASQY